MILSSSNCFQISYSYFISLILSQEGTSLQKGKVIDDLVKLNGRTLGRTALSFYTLKWLLSEKKFFELQDGTIVFNFLALKCTLSPQLKLVRLGCSSAIRCKDTVFTNGSYLPTSIIHRRNTTGNLENLSLRRQRLFPLGKM